MAIEHAYGQAVLLDGLREAIEELRDLDLDTVGASALDEAVVELARLRATLDATEAHMLGRWEASQEWRASGARSAGAALAHRTRLPASECHRRLRHARELRSLPKVAAAWDAGDIDRAHVSVLLHVRNPRTAAAFEGSQDGLLELARGQSFLEFQRACETWLNLADQDGAERRDAEDRAARKLHHSQSISGLWFGRYTCDPVSGEIIETTLREIEDELYRADRAAARERLGRDPLVFELGRTPEQRRHDAYVEMAIRARTAPKDGRRPKPLFTVVVGYERLSQVVELWNRSVLNPAAAARWLTDADVERIVFDGTGRVVDVGRRRRFFRGALRRAIEVRDRSCFHETCDEAPRWPQIDHEHEAAKGGETTQENGRLGCDFHNNLRNQRSDHRTEARPPPRQ
jgi:hypothetical protein